jgi:hypothetical protein
VFFAHDVQTCCNGINGADDKKMVGPYQKPEQRFRRRLLKTYCYLTSAFTTYVHLYGHYIKHSSCTWWIFFFKYTGCSYSRFTEKPDIKTTYLLSIVLQKWSSRLHWLGTSASSCTHTETCFNTFKQVSTRITVRNKVELLFSSRYNDFLNTLYIDLDMF